MKMCHLGVDFDGSMRTTSDTISRSMELVLDRPSSEWVEEARKHVCP